MHNSHSFLFCVLNNSSTACVVNCLEAGTFILTVFRRAWKFFPKFCPLYYKQVIALSPRRIGDFDFYSMLHSEFTNWSWPQLYRNTKVIKSENYAARKRFP